MCAMHRVTIGKCSAPSQVNNYAADVNRECQYKSVQRKPDADPAPILSTLFATPRDSQPSPQPNATTVKTKIAVLGTSG